VTPRLKPGDQLQFNPGDGATRIPVRVASVSASGCPYIAAIDGRPMRYQGLLSQTIYLTTDAHWRLEPST